MPGQTQAKPGTALMTPCGNFRGYMKKREVLLWLLVLCFYTIGAEAEPRIRSISFEGNRVTEESMLLREMYIKEGDVLDEQRLQKSVQAIRDLGLFEDVSHFLAEDYTDPDDADNVVDVVILLEEKYYLLILPRARVDDDEMHLGIQVYWDNIWGLNHSMRFLVEDRGATEGVSEQRQRITYNYPNVNGSRYSLGFQLLNMNDVDDTEVGGAVNRKDGLLGINLSKWLNPAGRNQGWFIGLGIDAQYRENLVISGSLQDEKLDAIILKLRYGYQSVHEYAYNRGGKEFGYQLDVSDGDFGSNSEFVKHYLYYRSYYRSRSRPDDNLNVQTLLGYATDDILGDAAFSLGSSQDLRGYSNNVYEGNALLLMNIEYLTPKYNYRSLRYVYFLDIGSTYNDFSEILHENLKTGIGFGIRWKIPKFVKLDLRMDIGYGISEDDYHVSLGTRHAF